MGKIFLPARPLLIVFTMLAALLLFSPSIVNAYDVQIQNSTDVEITVALYISGLFFAKQFEQVNIGARQSYTFHTGAICSAYLLGTASTGNGLVDILPIGCAGLIEGNTAGGICCFDINFSVQIINGIYRFVKQ